MPTKESNVPTKESNVFTQASTDLQVLDENANGLGLVIELLVDDKRLLEEALRHANGCYVEAIELVEPVDVLHNATLVLLGKITGTSNLPRFPKTN